jgi:hypothetical protein
MSRALVWSSYALLVGIWSSTWVAIKVGLGDTPPLLGAGVRFLVAGVGLLVLASLWRRSLRTDVVLAVVLAVLPFAATYGLIYWSEQYVPSGLAAVLFGVLPIYVALIASAALHDEPLRARLLVGVVLALGGLVVAFSESVALGDSRYAVVAAFAWRRRDGPQRVGGVRRRRPAPPRLGGRGVVERCVVDRLRARLDPVPGGRRDRARVRDAHAAAARAAGRDDVVHLAAAAVRGAGVRGGGRG